MLRYGLRDDQFTPIEHLLPGWPGNVERSSDRGKHLLVGRDPEFCAGAPVRDIPDSSATARIYTGAFRDGLKRASGSGCSGRSSTIPTTNTR